MSAESWQADTKVNIHPIFDLSSGSSDDTLSCLFVTSSDLGLLAFHVHNSEFNLLYVFFSLDNSVGVAGGQMDIFGVQLSVFNDLLDLNNTDLSSASHGGVEVASRLPEDNVADLVSLPASDNRVVTSDGFFHDVVAAIKLSTLATLSANNGGLTVFAEFDWEATVLKNGLGASGREEGSDTCATSSALFSEGALRNKLNLKLASQVLLLKVLVFTNV